MTVSGDGLAGVPDQLWVGEWVPAPDQPVDPDGLPLPVPPKPAEEADR